MGYIRIYSFTDSKTCFEQELYTGFSFVQPLSFFHHFEGTSCVYGLSFADDSDSGKFAENLAICVEDMGGSSQLSSGGGGSGRHHAAAAPPPMAHAPPVAAPMATPPPVAAPSQEYAPPTPPPSSSNDGPTSTPPMNTTPIQRSESPAQKRGKKEPTKKKGKFGFFRSKKQKKPAAEMVIGGPTDFKHESHIGWDMENGFDIRNIPPEWRKLFQAAGVKKSDLQDADTRKLIVSTINASGASTDAPPRPMAPAPPPAPIKDVKDLITEHGYRNISLDEPAEPAVGHAECVVCMSEKTSHAFVPCGHMCVCSECAKENFTSCPICRAAVVNIYKIYA